MHWLRSNLLALVVIAGAIPVLFLLTVTLPLSYSTAAEPSIRPVDAGETTEFGGYRWTLTASKEFPGTGVDGNKTPLGTSLTAAIIEIRSTDAAPTDQLTCDATLTDSRGREWTDLSSPSEYGYGIADDSKSYCVLDPTEPTNLEVVFLTPPGVYDSATIDVRLTSGPSTVLRFDLHR